MILETERLYLRELNQGDFEALSRILTDEETMYAYNGAFSPEETREWLDRQLTRYKKYGFGLWHSGGRDCRRLLSRRLAARPEKRTPRPEP